MYLKRTLSITRRLCLLGTTMLMFFLFFQTSVNAQSASCNCTEYIYLNEPTTGGAVHKFSVASDGSLTEIGMPWFDNAAAGDSLVSPHGLGVDKNGNIYIGETAGGDIRQFTCDGDIRPITEFEIKEGGTNIAVVGNILYVNAWNAIPDGIYAYDLCTGDAIGYYCLNGILEGEPVYDSDWGFSIIDNETIVVSDSYFSAEKNDVWVFDISTSTLNDITEPNPVCIDPLISEDDGIVNVGDNELTSWDIYGVTLDNAGNIYIVETQFLTFNSIISKYDSNGLYVGSTPVDNVEGDGGFYNAIAITYSETADKLYVSTQSPLDDCISIVNPNTMLYEEPAIGATGSGDNAKGIAITKECCPINPTTTVNQLICGQELNEKIFLQDLISCEEGTVCGQDWVINSVNGFTFDNCDQTIAATVPGACGTFELTSPGTSSVAQCGAFSIILNVCFECGYDIGNYVWIDEDGDGDQDAGESGIPGVTVYLQDDMGVVLDSTITDFNGGYIFENNFTENYIVKVDEATLPTGLTNATFDLDGTLDHQTAINLVADQLDVDFGYNYTLVANTNTTTGIDGAIGNRIWSDSNSNGKQDLGEVGIANVTVMLLDDSNTQIATTTTDAAGYYVFTNLAAGFYAIEVDATTLPTNFTTTPTGDPDADGTNTSELIVLAPGDVYLRKDFGYNSTSTYSISDQLYVDLNADGAYTSGELPIGMISVALVADTNNDGVWDDDELPIANMITDENGVYEFTGVSDGNYLVVVTDTENILKDFENTADPDGGIESMSKVTIAGADNIDQDFGYAPQGHSSSANNVMVGSVIYLDIDANGMQDPNEPGIQGVKVELRDASDNLLKTTTTDNNGMYLFGGLPADTYKVKVDVLTLPGAASIPAGLTQSADPDGVMDNESTTAIAAGTQDLIRNFGYTAAIPNTISGTIWEDMDANGTLDETTPTYFENVTVLLYDDQNMMVGTTTTDVNGNYSFTGLPDGTYTIDVTDNLDVLADYWKSSGVPANATMDNNSQLETYEATVFGGSTDVTGDFGYYKEPASLGNLVWQDNNGNGIQDTGEPGLIFVSIMLSIDFDNDGTFDISRTTTTGFGGKYSFNNLLLDEDYNGTNSMTSPTYQVSVIVPNGYIKTGINAYGNANDMVDSDIHDGAIATPAQGNRNVDLTNLTEGQASYDFGLIPFNCSTPIVQYAITNGAVTNPGQTTNFFHDPTTNDVNHIDMAQEFGVIRGITYCEHDGWRYYFNPNDPDEYLLAIEMLDNVTEIEWVQITVENQATLSNRYAIGSTDATFVMARDWHVQTVNEDPLVDAAGDPTTVNIRFYFPPEEYEKMLTDANAQASQWGLSALTPANVYWFKKDLFAGPADVDATGSNLLPNDITNLRNAMTDITGNNTAITALTVENGRNHIQFNGINSFSGGTAGITINTPLAIDVSSFEINTENCNNTLFWEVENEEAFSHFVVEKSDNGVQFATIGEINLNDAMAYSFEDPSTTNNTYYRLKLVNLDGTFEYTSTLSAMNDCNEGASNIKLYPNPATATHDVINLDFYTSATNANVTIMDNIGRVIYNNVHQTQEGENNLKLDISDFPTGIYLVNLEIGMESESLKLIKMN